MSSEHIKVTKSYETRLEEYNYILLMHSPSSITSNSSVEISSVWTSYLELHLQPKGWNAIWYILRHSCADLQIRFPKIVEVVVDKVNYDTLTAEVRIAASENGDIEVCDMPDKIADAPLKDLYVTTFQEDPNVDAYAVAEYLDQLRLFYHHLWWPWDAEQEYDCNINWLSDHLENRLKMYYDKLWGNVHYISGKAIKRLMERGEELYDKLKAYSEDISSANEEDLLENVSVMVEMESNFDELELIKAQLRKWEIPQLRKMEDERNREKSRVSRTMIVIPDSDVVDIDRCLQFAQNLVKSDGLENRILTRLEDALADYFQNDTIILCSRENLIAPREYFDFPLNLIGLPVREIYIKDTRSHWCLFECLSENIFITDVKFEVKYVRSVLVVKRGALTLDRVRLEANGDCPVDGIHVFENASLIATNCEFINFDHAVTCFGKSSIKLDRCSFENNNACLKVSEESRIQVLDCDMVRTRGIPIQLEGSEDNEGIVRALSYATSPCHKIHRCKFANESKVFEMV